ncbi:MAG: hypothetical protein M1401_14240 [Chloroflexi bacterium]|nr:hypothetical protein [Chloroflexota bacterium]
MALSTQAPTELGEGRTACPSPSIVVLTSSYCAKLSERKTIYHPLRLYAEHTREIALDAYVACDAYALDPTEETSPRPHRVADLGPFPVLDLAASRDAAGKNLVLAVVNRDPERAQTTAIELAEPARVLAGTAFEVNGTDPTVVNSFAQPEAVAVRERPLGARPLPLSYTFPPHSLTLLRLGLAVL